MKTPLFLFLATLTAFSVWAQVAGDYRTKNASSTWSTAGDWETFDGAAWSTASSKPTSANSVYIQSGHTVTLAGNEACKDFNFCKGSTGNTSPGSVALGTYTLSVSGVWRAYNGTVGTIPGTASSGQLGAYPFTGTGKVSFVGSSRNMFATGSSSSTAPTSIGSTVFPLWIDLDSGQTLTMNGGFVVSSCTVNSGTLDTTTQSFRLNTGVAGQADLTINSGATLRSSKTGATAAQFGRTGTAGSGNRAGTLTVNSGGTLEFYGATPTTEMNAFVFNGVVHYSLAGSQTWLGLPTSADPSSAVANTYSDVTLSGSNAKSLAANTTVNGKLTLGGTASLGLGSFALTYGTSATLVYAGSSSQTTANNEFPSAGIPNLTINNAAGVALNGSKTVNGTLTLTSGMLTVGANTLTLNGPPIAGTPENLTTSSSSSLSFGGSSSGVSVPASVTALNNLSIGNSSGVTLGGNLTVAGTPTINSGCTLNDGGYTLTAQGASINNNGSWSGSGKLLVAGTVTQTLNAGGGAIYGNVEVANTSATVLLSSVNSFAVNSPNTFTIDSGATVQSQNKSITGTGNFTMASGATLVIGNGTGISTGSGVVQVTGTRTFDPAANYLIRGFTGNCNMGAGFPVTVNNLTIDLTAANLTATLQSSVTVNGTLALTTGTLDIPSAGTLFANGSSTGSSSVTVSGGALRGTGSVNGAVTVSGSGKLQAGAGSIGTLTLASAPTLGGSVIARLNTSNTQTADKLVLSAGTMTYGGSLVLTNIGPALTHGQVFTLFNAPFYGGAFSSITPGGGTHWKTDNLAVNGTISFTNNAPVAQDFTTSVFQGDSVNVDVLASKKKPTDTDNDTLTITAVGIPTSGLVTTNGGTGFIYTATNATVGTNTFTYTVGDGYGGAAQATVTMVVYAAQSGLNITGFTYANPVVTVTAQGVPGATYRLQYTTNASPHLWLDVSGSDTQAGMNNGTMVLQDTGATDNLRFYRTKYISGP